MARARATTGAPSLASRMPCRAAEFQRTEGSDRADGLDSAETGITGMLAAPIRTVITMFWRIVMTLYFDCLVLLGDKGGPAPVTADSIAA